MSVSAYNAIGALEEFLFGSKEEPTNEEFANSYRGHIVEPQHAYCWEFKMTGAGGSFEQDARLYAQEVSIPAMEQEAVVKEYRGKRIKYQGKNSSSLEINVTFYDTQDLAMYKTIYKWFRSMNELKKNNSIKPYGDKGFFSVSDEKKLEEAYGFNDPQSTEGYMKSCEITLMDTTERTPTARYVFSDVFPVSLGEVSLSYDSSEIMTFDVKFSYFDVDVEFGGGDSGGFLGLF